MIETAVYNLLVTEDTLTALVEDRIYPKKLPQAPTYPAITFKIVSDISQYSMAGPSLLGSARFQFDLFAETDQGLTELKRVFMALMSGHRDTPGDDEVIQGVFRSGEFEDVEAAIDRTNKVWRKIIDFIIWYKETYQ